MKWLTRWFALHTHRCGCGDWYLCGRPQGCESLYTCIRCETAQLMAWIADYERRHPNRIKGGN